MKTHLNSESGMAFIATIIMVGSLILSYFFFSTTYYANMTQDADRAKRILATYEVVGSLAVEIRRAYDMANYPGGAVCEGGTSIRAVNGNNYCLPAQVCVQNPLNRLEATAGTQICWNPTSQLGDIAGVNQNSFDSVFALWNKGLYLTGEATFNFLSQVSSQASAQAAPESHLPPNIAGGTAVNLSNLTCAGNIHCQSCGNPNTWPVGACVLLDICLMNGGCPTPQHRVKQWISMVR